MNGLLLLSDICEEYFCITERIAQRKASLGMLPVPAFRVSGTRKGPLYIRQLDLDAFIQSQFEKARKLNSKMRQAGLV
jgi:hypothetical protein